jgi:hypothetical protein
MIRFASLTEICNFSANTSSLAVFKSVIETVLLVINNTLEGIVFVFLGNKANCID